MLKIIFYCYSRGIITSRLIEYACKTNIIVKALAQDADLHHDTLVHFISSQAEAVKELFAQVLSKYYASGLAVGELFAMDGCKLPSNAVKEWSGTLEELGKKKKYREALMEKIIVQHIQFNAQTVGEKDLSGGPMICGRVVKRKGTDVLSCGKSGQWRGLSGLMAGNRGRI